MRLLLDLKVSFESEIKSWLCGEEKKSQKIVNLNPFGYDILFDWLEPLYMLRST